MQIDNGFQGKDGLMPTEKIIYCTENNNVKGDDHEILSNVSMYMAAYSM